MQFIIFYLYTRYYIIYFGFFIVRLIRINRDTILLLLLLLYTRRLSTRVVICTHKHANARAFIYYFYAFELRGLRRTVYTRQRYI